jgi:hypothetical protein
MVKEVKSKKPGMKLLTGKERSSLAKRAVAGKDIGKKGKMFSRVADSAALKYGSEEAGNRVAAAAMIKARAAKKK